MNPMNETAQARVESMAHDTFIDRVFKLDKQQAGYNADTAKRCPTHKSILAVNRQGLLYCADLKARTCEHLEIGQIDELQ